MCGFGRTGARGDVSQRDCACQPMRWSGHQIASKPRSSLRCAVCVMAPAGGTTMPGAPTSMGMCQSCSMTRVACIGGGSWGTTVAILIAQNGHDVVMWCRRDDLANEVNVDHSNERYLPGVRLPDNLRATSDIAEAMQGAELCDMGV